MADRTTQSGLTKLYNERVVKAEHVTRPMGSSGGSANVPFVNHQGVRVTTESGNQYLVHKGAGYGKSSQTVVTDASHMSSKWSVENSKPVSGASVGDYVKAGGQKYSLNPFSSDTSCIGSARDMYKLGQ